MTDQQTPTVRRPRFADQAHAYDPVTQPQLFDGVIGKRSLAFVVDVIIVGAVTFVLGLVTLGLVWLLFPAIFLVFLAYNAVTIGGKNSATVGQRLMGLEARMWSGEKVSPLIAAFHALLFWFATSTVVGWFIVVFWAFFDARKRCLHDILAGMVIINRP